MFNKNVIARPLNNLFPIFLFAKIYFRLNNLLYVS